MGFFGAFFFSFLVTCAGSWGKWQGVCLLIKSAVFSHGFFIFYFTKGINLVYVRDLCVSVYVLRFLCVVKGNGVLQSAFCAFFCKARRIVFCLCVYL